MTNKGVHRVLVGKPEGKRPLGRHRRRWEDNIKMDLQVGWSCRDWMELAEDRDRWRALVGTVRNLRVPKMRGISWLAAEPVSFSRRTLLHGVSKYMTNKVIVEKTNVCFYSIINRTRQAKRTVLVSLQPKRVDRKRFTNSLLCVTDN
jgi:hypothetical protein